eukprot:5950143-Pyramimonas_sp.AAC.1
MPGPQSAVQDVLAKAFQYDHIPINNPFDGRSVRVAPTCAEKCGGLCENSDTAMCAVIGKFNMYA